MNRETILEILQNDYSESNATAEGPFTSEIFAQKFEFKKSKDAPGTGYKFDAVTLGDVLDYVLIDRARRYHYGHEGSPFAWNVKAHPDYNGTEDTTRDSSLDSAWSKYLDKHGESVWCEAYEMAQDYYRRDWCSYPGDDQGDFKFGFYGRSGGWLCLVEWREFNLQKMDSDDCANFIAGLVASYLDGGSRADYLEAFYRALVCADSEFTWQNASKNVSHYFGEARERWEEQRAQDLPVMLQHVTRCAISKTLADYGLEIPESLGATLDAIPFESLVSEARGV